jgi:hypothetical protein
MPSFEKDSYLINNVLLAGLWVASLLKPFSKQKVRLCCNVCASLLLFAGEQKLDTVSCSHFLPHQHLLPEKRLPLFLKRSPLAALPTAAVCAVLLLFPSDQSASATSCSTGALN